MPKIQVVELVGNEHTFVFNQLVALELSPLNQSRVWPHLGTDLKEGGHLNR